MGWKSRVVAHLATTPPSPPSLFIQSLEGVSSELPSTAVLLRVCGLQCSLWSSARIGNREDRQPLVKPSAVVAAGLASALAAFFTSRFGVAGTVVGQH